MWLPFIYANTPDNYEDLTDLITGFAQGKVWMCDEQTDCVDAGGRVFRHGWSIGESNTDMMGRSRTLKTQMFVLFSLKHDNICNYMYLSVGVHLITRKYTVQNKAYRLT